MPSRAASTVPIALLTEVIGVVAGLFLVVTLAACSPAPEHKPYLTRFDRPLHISHQGGEDIHPTNTMYAFERSVSHYRTDVLELDVHRTADDVLVVLHDETVDRTTNGSGLVKEMTLRELQALDAAYTFTMDDGETFPERGEGHRIPMLAEVFRAFPDRLTNIEIKQREPPIEQDLVDLILEHDMQEHVCLGSFDDGVAKRLRELLPEACHYAPENMAREYFIGSRVRVTGFLPPPVDAFALPVTSGDTEVIDSLLIDTLHEQGKHLWAWTIDEESEMRRLLELGVDGIMTNRPDLLDDVMVDMGLR